MSIWLQHTLVLILVLLALLWVLRQVVSTFRKASGGLGSCCSKGCGEPTNTSANMSPARTVFLPIESLTLKQRH